mgnify:CR=1 FL=1
MMRVVKEGFWADKQIGGALNGAYMHVSQGIVSARDLNLTEVITAPTRYRDADP